MIPKIVHYCWFGKGGVPPLNKKCIETWSKLEGFDFMLWDESNSPMDDPLIKALYKKKQWAFISDYVRLYALNKYGGVYLDTDIEIVKDLTPLLMFSAFIGLESEDKYNNAVMGAIQGHQFLVECMDFMRRNFESGKVLYSPEVVTSVLKFSHKINDVTLLSQEYFYPYNPYRNDSLSQLMFHDITQNTYAIHHWSNSWKSSMSILDYIKRVYKKLK
ncbi:glycosyltransferase [Aeromonas caviae]